MRRSNSRSQEAITFGLTFIRSWGNRGVEGRPLRYLLLLVILPPYPSTARLSAGSLPSPCVSAILRLTSIWLLVETTLEAGSVALSALFG